MEENKEHHVFEIKPYTKKELQEMYGIPRTTFRRWLRSIPETGEPSKRNWLTAAQIEAFIKVYGVPGQKRFQKILNE